MKMMCGRIANAKDDNVYMSGKSFPINSRKGSSKTKEQAYIFVKRQRRKLRTQKLFFFLEIHKFFAFIFYKIFAERGNCVT